MKPRIKKIKGLWRCYALRSYVGVGYTPAGAYEDWRALNMAHGVGA